MQRNIWRCVRIIEDLLEFSRERKVRTEPVKIDQWIAREVEELQLPSGVAVETDLKSGAIATVDTEKMRQLLTNLVQNAEHAIEQIDRDAADGGSIEISSARQNGQLELQVSDNGRGIKPEHIDKIFGPLFSTKAFGVGLGLPLVKRIVDAHDGEIGINSDWGKGTEVTIRLPLDRRDEAAE